MPAVSRAQSQLKPSRCPCLCADGPVQQLCKVNKVRFSNPKRLLKPLLICLPFCLICSAQVKGNLTFGILPANNAVPETGMCRSACVHTRTRTRVQYKPNQDPQCAELVSVTPAVYTNSGLVSLGPWPSSCLWEAANYAGVKLFLLVLFSFSFSPRAGD